MRHPSGLPSRLSGLDRCLVMGVLNVTPDSFSDGGDHHATGMAIAHGLALIGSGADIVDVGGESTRPGAQRVSAQEEMDRVIPVIEALAGQGVPVSVDTMRSVVAAAAVDAGACLVNDVSGGLADPEMGAWLSGADVPYVAMHWRGHSERMQELTAYDDIVSDVAAELRSRVEALASSGVDPARIILDVGIGFAKEPDQNWALLRALPTFVEMGHPILVGASRKRFLGILLADADADAERPASQRDRATDAITVLSASAGAWAVRVHDVTASRDAIAVVRAWHSGSAEGIEP